MVNLFIKPTFPTHRRLKKVPFCLVLFNRQWMVIEEANSSQVCAMKGVRVTTTYCRKEWDIRRKDIFMW